MRKDRNRGERRNLASKVINSLVWLLGDYTFGQILHARCTHVNGERKIRLQHKYGAHLQQLKPTERPPGFCCADQTSGIALRLNYGVSF